MRVSAPRRPTDGKGYLDLYRCQEWGERVDRHVAVSDCDWFGLTPLVAWAMASTLEIQGDRWILMAGSLDIPPCARRFVDDEEFCRRMKASAHHLAEQLAGGNGDAEISRCTADEVNLAMALTDAPNVDEMLTVPAMLLGATALGIEYDWDEASDCLFHDHDVFMLWNPMLDGIENDIQILAALGTSRLDPDGWFEPFTYVTEPIT